MRDPRVQPAGQGARAVRGVRALVLITVVVATLAGVAPASAAPPDNDDAAFATAVDFFPFETTVDLARASVEPAEPQPPTCSGASSAPSVASSVWYRFRAPSSQWFSLSTKDHAYFGTVVTIYRGSDPVALSPVKCAQGWSPNGVTIAVDRGAVYHVQVGLPAAHASRPESIVKVSARATGAPGEDFEDAEEVGKVPFSVTRWPATFVQPGEPTPTCVASGASIVQTAWYRFDPQGSANLLLSLDGWSLTRAAVYRGTSLDALVELGCVKPATSIEVFAPDGPVYVQVGLESSGQSPSSFTFSLARLGRPSNDDIASARYAPEFTIDAGVATDLATMESGEPRPRTCVTSRVRSGRPSFGTLYNPEPPPAGNPTIGASVWYMVPGKSGELTLGTGGSAFDTVLAVYTRDASGAFVEVACNDDAGGGVRTSTLTFAGKVDVNYYVQLAGKILPGGSQAERGRARLTGRWGIPAANDAFARRAIVTPTLTGHAATDFATTEAGELTRCGAARFGRTLWYWSSLHPGTYEVATTGSMFDTVLVAYTTPPNAPSTDQRVYLDCNDDAGTRTSVVRFTVTEYRNYFFQVGGKASGLSGAAYGTIAVHVRQVSTGTDNDAFSAAERIARLPFTKTETMAGATREPGEPSSCSNGGGSRWYRFTPDDHMTLLLRTSSPDATLAFYTLPDLQTSVGQLQERACAYSGSLKIAAARAVTYYVRVEGDPAGSMTVQLLGAGAPDNDAFKSAKAITPDAAAVGATWWATRESGEPSSCGDGSSLWYRVTPDAPSTLLLDASASPTPAVVSVHTGSDLPQLATVACKETTDPARLKVRGAKGQTYFIRVATPPGADGDVHVRVTAATPPPNDDFAAAQSVAGGQTVGADTAWATDEAHEPRACGGSSSVWYRYDNATADPRTVVLDTSGTASDVKVAVYSGTGVNSLSNLACDDGSPSERLKFSARAYTTYWIQVSASNQDDEGPFMLAVRDATPPAHDDVQQAKVVGDSGAFTFDNRWATDQRDEGHPCGGYSTMWLKTTPSADRSFEIALRARDDAGDALSSVIAVQTGSSFASFSTVACEHATEPTVRFKARANTTYFIQVGTPLHAEGTIDVQVSSGVPPANDAFAAMETVSLGSTKTADTRWATDESGEPHACGVSGAVWYRYQAPTAAPVTFDTAGSKDPAGADMAGALAIYTGPQLTALAAEDCANGSPYSSVTLTPVAGKTYYIQVGPTAARAGTVKLNVRSSPLI